MENSLFQEAKQKVTQMMNTEKETTETDLELANHALQAAYEQATPEEKQELQQLEQQLKQKL